ncbi:MAG TPA: acyl-CoA dehydrogenase family protein [Ferrovibrio sp.]|uniref:acyl-CoA dehydrogenase family protein n=1 Tax=Ferrovibrio sp. TaxID=1917215 RepID=UPI002B4B47E6|nr:acyl-CoA dehydrogenase family protein [Ferrovibrio sp.]HLT76242.1 acyl-CoA dehydrogenase family protein [Ferrovibrio sp.]
MNVHLKDSTKIRNATEIARALGRDFAARAADYDATDSFAAENFREIREAGLLSIGVPAELGGGDASYRELCGMLRETARHCSGTALALAMHTHPLAAAVWRWRKGDKAPVEGLLKRVAAENLMLLSTGGNDWLGGSGTAEKTEGGYLFSGRKRFVSGCEAGDILMTMAREGDTVLHAGVPMKSKGVRIEQTWRTLGMRASGSQDVVLDKVFVPEAAIAVRRPAGVWHPFFHLVSVIAWPLIYSVYRGVAEKLRDETVTLAMRKRQDGDTLQLIGALDTALAAAVAAHEQMVALGETATPGEAVTSTMMTLKRVMTEQMLEAASIAMDAAGGSAFYRAAGIEKLFRDIQAARYHPLAMQPQHRLAGRIALGFTADGGEQK